MQPTDLPQTFFPHWVELREIAAVSRLDGGELKDVYRIDAEGGPYALRVYTPDVSVNEVATELAFTAPFSERLTEVPAVMPTTNGESTAIEDGRVAVLTTFVEGERPDRRNPQHHRAGAEMLAQLHEIAASIDVNDVRTVFPARHNMDWQTNRWWSWLAIERYLDDHELDGLAGTDTAGLHRRLIGEVTVLTDALDQVAKLELPSIPVHGDYWEGNLIVRGDKVVGVVDWDECTVDWRAIEIIDAACSFGRGENDYDFNPVAANEFLNLYVQAGGEILEQEREALLPLRKIRLLWETLYELGRACQGFPLDQAHLWGNLISLDGVAEDVFREE